MLATQKLSASSSTATARRPAHRVMSAATPASATRIPPTQHRMRAQQPAIAQQQQQRALSVVVVAAATAHQRSSLASSSFGTRITLQRRRPRAPSAAAARRSSSVLVQANLFARISRLVKATLDNLLGSFEDPEKLLDRVVEEMTQDTLRMRQAAAQAVASERQMRARTQTTQAAADQWLRRAELAVAAGQDDLAREALSRRKALQGDADRLRQQADAQKAACDQLQGSVRMLENKISEARNKKATLKARAASAKSSMAINEMIGGLKSAGQNSFAAFEKMEEKVLALEAEAQTTAALVAPDSLEARFSQLEGGGVEDELLALKASVGSPGRAASATAGRPRVDEVLVRTGPAVVVDSAIERELEDLRRRAARM